MPKEPSFKRVIAKQLVDGSGRPPQDDVAILIEDNVIREIGHRDEVVIPPDTTTIDLSGSTVMPGIIDAHMHFFGVPSDKLHLYYSEDDVNRALRSAGEARKMLEAGITAARCCGSSISPALRRAIDEGHIPGPRIVAAGEFICSTSGTWDHFSVPYDIVKANDMYADGVEGVRDIVRRRVRSGASVIKVGLSKAPSHHRNHSWGEDPFNQLASYSMDEIKALTEETHRNNLKVSAHCIGDKAVRAALEGGVDTIEHGYGITESTRKMLIDQNALIVSTISQLYFHEQAAGPYHYHDWETKLYDDHLDAMRSDFEKNLKVGVRYALGTDLVGYPTHPQDMAAKEFELAVNWGMTTSEAIVAGTKTSAEALGLEGIIGTIEVGKLADIIGLSGDPIKDITELQRVQFVMQDGDALLQNINNHHS